MNEENYKRIIFGVWVFTAGIILTIIGHPVLGVSGGLTGLYFIFTE